MPTAWTGRRRSAGQGGGRWSRWTRGAAVPVGRVLLRCEGAVALGEAVDAQGGTSTRWRGEGGARRCVRGASAEVAVAGEEYGPGGAGVQVGEPAAPLARGGVACRCSACGRLVGGGALRSSCRAVRASPYMRRLFSLWVSIALLTSLKAWTMASSTACWSMPFTRLPRPVARVALFALFALSVQPVCCHGLGRSAAA